MSKSMMSARFAFFVPMISAAAVAQEVAQEQGPLPTDQAIPGLMFFTLGAVLLIAVGGLIYFLRRRSNRAAMERVIED